MSFTITITVSPTGAAEVSTGADVTEEPPEPTLLGGPGDGGTEQAMEADAEAPPPLPPEELGIAAASETGAEEEGPPPEELEDVGEGDAELDAPDPSPIEELE